LEGNKSIRKKEHDTEIHAILVWFTEFPIEVETFAQKIDLDRGKKLRNRRDMRTLLTIDPKDAKDFDDALSFKKLENGNYEIEFILLMFRII
jgi:ribonuclease R